MFRKQLVVVGVKRARLTYLEPRALADLFDVAREADRASLPGDIIEAGCALGGSAIVLATAKRRERPLRVYDVFGMIPAPGDKDGPEVAQRYRTIVTGGSEGLGDDVYYGYQEDLLGKVSKNLEGFGVPPSENNIELVPGLYEDTLQPTGHVCLAHIDCDWHDSVKVCLERLHPHLVAGGRMVIDDYDSWSGCRQAVDDFLEDHDELYRTERRSRLHLVRI